MPLFPATLLNWVNAVCRSLLSRATAARASVAVALTMSLLNSSSGFRRWGRWRLFRRDIGVDGGQSLALLFGFGCLAVLPVKPAADGGEEQDNAADDPAAIALAEVAELVLAKVLVDLAQEGFAGIGGKRQERASISAVTSGTPLPFPRSR